jgi:hypothetical protein
VFSLLTGSGKRLERRAARIADPVERLRYLRREASVVPPARGPAFTVRRAALGIALIALCASPGPWPAGSEVAASDLPPQPRSPAPAPPSPADEVWLVEATSAAEVYSNGLRIELAFAVRNRPRSPYPVYALEGDVQPVETAREPRGIVYHTTESHLAPFEEEANGRLKRLGRNLLELLRREQSYHYLIDRFGRVFRVVEESDAANHAGRSVWGDERGLYVDLNDSFLGIAFEAQTGAAEAVTAGQITAARQLTEMLRARYPSIRPEDCVAHAQVSVSPWNMLIANHADWARGFPFAALGLPDNYALAPPSLTAFGFGYDEVFLQVSGQPWPGLALAARQIAERARAQGLTEANYRKRLQRRYKEILEARQYQHESQ